jgi:hypothetical protein
VLCFITAEQIALAVEEEEVEETETTAKLLLLFSSSVSHWFSPQH